jgi:hypothetical protein
LGRVEVGMRDQGIRGLACIQQISARLCHPWIFVWNFDVVGIRGVRMRFLPDGIDYELGTEQSGSCPAHQDTVARERVLVCRGYEFSNPRIQSIDSLLIVVISLSGGRRWRLSRDTHKGCWLRGILCCRTTSILQMAHFKAGKGLEDMGHQNCDMCCQWPKDPVDGVGSASFVGASPEYRWSILSASLQIRAVDFARKEPILHSLLQTPPIKRYYPRIRFIGPP